MAWEYGMKGNYGDYEKYLKKSSCNHLMGFKNAENLSLRAHWDILSDREADKLRL